MSCSNATAPVNITNNTTSTCDLKCDYSFKYPISDLQVTNRGEYLSMRTDQTSSPPVQYNSEQYNVSDVRIYRPSLHTYGGSKADAEIIIVHKSSTGSGNLLVCIPIVKNSGGTSTTMLETVISQVAKTAPSANDKTVVSLPTLSLDSFVPMKPFYSYNGTLPYSPCNGTYSYIVFSKNNEGSLSISTAAYAVLSKIVSANSYTVKNGSGGVYYNAKGPSESAVGGDIYIECNPTGEDGEVIVQTAPSSPSSLFSSSTFKDITNSKIFQVIVAILVLAVIMKLGRVALRKLSDAYSKTGTSGAQTGGKLGRCR